MSIITNDRARSAAIRQGFTTESAAKTEFRKSASQSASNRYHVFLSHAHSDGLAILGIRTALEAAGLKVYVDWIDDPQEDRSRVTPAVGAMLRQRMQASQSLIFVLSEGAKTSVWMPWELGYFDGFRPGHIALLPIRRSSVSPISGQEYLGLYPEMEDISGGFGTLKLGVKLSDGRDFGAEELPAKALTVS